MRQWEAMLARSRLGGAHPAPWGRERGRGKCERERAEVDQAAITKDKPSGKSAERNEELEGCLSLAAKARGMAGKGGGMA